MKQVWSVGKEYDLLVRNHICYCFACTVKDFENCEIKVKSETRKSFNLKINFQEYTDRPELVSFTPVRKRPLPTLRRKRCDESDHNSHLAGCEFDNKDEEEGVTCNIKVNNGRFYVVLGDSVEGYYVVKCMAALDKTFSGKYLKLTNDFVQNMIVFKETKESDGFDTNSVVAELTVVHDFSKSVTRFFATKSDMDDILMTVAEMSCI